MQVTGGPRIVTDATGVYAFDLPPGAWTVTASKPGYVTQTVTRAVTANQTIWGSMGLSQVPTPVDTDGDTITDVNDNCPLDANQNQRDTDADGEGNACDGDDDEGAKRVSRVRRTAAATSRPTASLARSHPRAMSPREQLMPEAHAQHGLLLRGLEQVIRRALHPLHGRGHRER